MFSNCYRTLEYNTFYSVTLVLRNCEGGILHGLEWLPSSENWLSLSLVEYFPPLLTGNRILLYLCFSLLQQVEVWHCEWHWTSISNWFHCVKVFIHGGGSLKEFKMGSFREYESVIWCKWSGQPYSLCLSLQHLELWIQEIRNLDEQERWLSDQKT